MAPLDDYVGPDERRGPSPFSPRLLIATGLIIALAGFAILLYLDYIYG